MNSHTSQLYHVTVKSFVCKEMKQLNVYNVSNWTVTWRHKNVTYNIIQVCLVSKDSISITQTNWYDTSTKNSGNQRSNHCDWIVSYILYLNICPVNYWILMNALRMMHCFLRLQLFYVYNCMTFTIVWREIGHAHNIAL